MGEVKAEAKENVIRCRVNLSSTAKGLVQWDITSEADTVEDTLKNMNTLIDSMRELVKAKGLTLAEDAEAKQASAKPLKG